MPFDQLAGELAAAAVAPFRSHRFNLVIETDVLRRNPAAQDAMRALHASQAARVVIVTEPGNEHRVRKHFTFATVTTPQGWAEHAHALTERSGRLRPIVTVAGGSRELLLGAQRDDSRTQLEILQLEAAYTDQALDEAVMTARKMDLRVAVDFQTDAAAVADTAQIRLDKDDPATVLLAPEHVGPFLAGLMPPRMLSRTIAIERDRGGFGR